MNMSEKASLLMEDVIKYAKSNHFEYITPEMLLLIMTDNEVFKSAFEECGGKIKKLSSELKKYINKYVEKIKEGEPTLSAGTVYAIAYGEQTAVNSSCEEIDVRHILHGIWQLDDSYAVYYMEKQNIDEAELLSMIAMIEEEDFDLEEGLDEDEDSYYSGESIIGIHIRLSFVTR